MNRISDDILQRISSIAPSVDGSCRNIPTGWGDVDRPLGGGLPLSGVHEWFSTSSSYLPLGVLIQMAWRAHSADSSTAKGMVAWVGRKVWPYPRSLIAGMRASLRRCQSSCGASLRDSDSACVTSLLEASVFMDAKSDADRLWSAEQCARCRGCVCVVVDATGFAMPATRRLQLAAMRAEGEPGILVMAARPWRERATLSAASTRWVVSSVAGGQEPGGSTNVRWRVQLLRMKGGVCVDGCVGEAEPAWEWEPCSLWHKAK